MASDGCTRTGRCGHREVAIIGQFFLCSVKDCDGRVRCPKCDTLQVEPFRADGLPDMSMHCIPNGHVWWSPA